MKSIKNIFRRKPKAEPMPLRIEGIAPAPMTPEPDDAELAAQALLEHMIEGEQVSKSEGEKNKTSKLKPPTSNLQPQSPEYYQQLSKRVQDGRALEAHLATRYVAYCEEMLKEISPQGRDDKPQGRDDIDTLGTLMQGLFKHQDAAEREGGELKRRWQHCIANIALAQML